MSDKSRKILEKYYLEEQLEKDRLRKRRENFNRRAEEKRNANIDYEREQEERKRAEYFNQPGKGKVIRSPPRERRKIPKNVPGIKPKSPTKFSKVMGPISEEINIYPEVKRERIMQGGFEDYPEGQFGRLYIPRERKPRGVSRMTEQGRINAETKRKLKAGENYAIDIQKGQAGKFIKDYLHYAAPPGVRMTELGPSGNNRRRLMSDIVSDMGLAQRPEVAISLVNGYADSITNRQRNGREAGISMNARRALDAYQSMLRQAKNSMGPPPPRKDKLGRKEYNKRAIEMAKTMYRQQAGVRAGSRAPRTRYYEI